MASIKVEAATADSFASRSRHDNAVLFCKCSVYNTDWPPKRKAAVREMRRNRRVHSTGWLKRLDQRMTTRFVFMMVPAFFEETPKPRPALRALSESDAVDIWIARWLRVRRKDLITRYGCDPRRLYEIWEGKKHPASRKKALERFQSEYPSLMDRVDFGRHKSLPRSPDNPDQLFLFAED